MPLTKYFANFTAHIDERKRPENFPHQIHDKQIFEVESLPHLQHEVNKRFVVLISSSGLVVPKDENEILEEGKLTFEKRMFVPWHMVTHVTLEVKMLSAEPSQEIIAQTDADKPKEWFN